VTQYFPLGLDIGSHDQRIFELEKQVFCKLSFSLPTFSGGAGTLLPSVKQTNPHLGKGRTGDTVAGQALCRYLGVEKIVLD